MILALVPFSIGPALAGRAATTPAATATAVTAAARRRRHRFCLMFGPSVACLARSRHRSAGDRAGAEPSWPQWVSTASAGQEQNVAYPTEHGQWHVIPTRCGGAAPMRAPQATG